MVPFTPSQVTFERGIRLFNRREFFECHEVLEDLWRPERGPRRLFLQGVIHLAVGFYHQQQGNGLGAERQLRKGLKKLAGYLPEYEGIDTLRLYTESIACLEQIGRGVLLDHFPQIEFPVTHGNAGFAGMPRPFGTDLQDL